MIRLGQTLLQAVLRRFGWMALPLRENEISCESVCASIAIHISDNLSDKR